MNRRQQERPPVKNILVDDFLTPDQIGKMQDNQIKFKGKVSTPNSSLEKTNSRGFIIETDRKEISRVSAVTPPEDTSQTPNDVQQGITKLERCLRLKLTKIKFHTLTKILGGAHHHNQKKFACRILALIYEWKRRQHTLRSFRHLFSYVRSKMKLPRAVPTILRLINRIRMRKVAEVFNQIAQYRTQERLSNKLGQQSQQASQISLVPSLDPNRLKHSQSSGSSRFARKPENLTERRPVPANLEQTVKDYEQMMLMSLSDEARDALIKMQRFDRYIYAQQSEKNLKVPIELELRRLERIKNSDKTLRNIYFDTQISITVLYNHIKTVFELNRELKEIDILREQNKSLEGKIIQTNVQKAKDIKQLTATLKKPADENTRLKVLQNELKQHKKLNELLYQSIREGGIDKIRKLIEVQLKKHLNETGKELSLDRREMLEIIQLLLNMAKEKPETKVEQQTIKNLSVIKMDLKNLLEGQTALQKNITHLEKQKKVYQAKEAESKTADTRELYSTLGLGSDYIISLYAEIKAKNAEISELGKKIQQIDKQHQRSERIKSDSEEKGSISLNKLKADLDNERSKSKELEKQLSDLSRSIKSEKQKQSKERQAKDNEQNDASLKQWEVQLANTLVKMDKQERTWYNDVQRQRKLLNTKRTTDRYTSIISMNVSLLENIIKRQKAIEELSAGITQLKQIDPVSESKKQELEERFSKQKERVKELTDQRNALKKQLQQLARVEKPEKKDLLSNELAQLQKAIANIEQIFNKQTESQTPLPLDWNRIKKMIDRRKFNSMLPAIGLIETLMRMLSEWEDAERRRLNETNKGEAIKQREMNALAALNKTIDRVLEQKNIKFEPVTFNRLRKILQNNLSKYQKAAESNDVAWCNMLKQTVGSKQKMLKIWEEERNNYVSEIEQLQGYVNQLQTQLKTEKQQYDKYTSETTPKINQLEHSLKTLQSNSGKTQKQQSDTILKLQEERGQLMSKLEKRDHDVKRLEDKIKSLENKQTDQLKQIKEFKEAIDVYSKQERAMLNAIELAENENRNLMAQLQILDSGVGEHDKQRAKVEHDRNQLTKKHQKIVHLQKQLEVKEDQIRRLEKEHRSIIDEFQNDMKNVEGNLTRLLQVNSTLEAQKQQMEKNITKNKRDLSQGESQLASENVKLNNEMIKMQQKLAVIESSFRQIEQQNARMRDTLNHKEEQLLNFTNKINELQKEVRDCKIENDKLVVNMGQLQHQIKAMKDRLIEAERLNRELVEQNRIKEEAYKNTIIQLRTEIQRCPPQGLIEQLKSDFKRKEDSYTKIIEEIRLSFARDKSSEPELIRLNTELERANKEISRMRVQIKSQEQYSTQLIAQNEAAIQRRSQSYESQIDLLRRQLDQISISHPEILRRLDNEHRQRENDLQRMHDETLNKCYIKQREMQNQMSLLRSEALRLSQSSTPSNTLQVELKKQEQHYQRIINESMVTSQSQIRLLEGESNRLKTEIARLQREAKQRQQYYTRLVESNEAIHASREKVSESSTTNNKLLQISKHIKDSGLEKQLQIQLKRQQEHYLKLIEQNASIFDSKEKTYQTQILNLHQEITKLTRQTVQHSIVQNLETELKRQQDHYIKLIEQNNVIFDSKEKSYETEITQLRQELSKYQINLRTLEDNHSRITQQNQALFSSKEKLLETEIGRLRVELIKMQTNVKSPAEDVQIELKKQKEYYTTIIQQNTRSYEKQCIQFEIEITRLKAELLKINRDQSNAGVIHNLQGELKRQEEHYLMLLSQNTIILQSKQRLFQTQINQMRAELNKTQMALQSQQDNYKKLLSQNSATSSQKIRSLQSEIASLKQYNAKLEINPPVNHSLLNEELRKQKQFYSSLLDDNANKYIAEEAKFQAEIRSLNTTNSTLIQQITRLNTEGDKLTRDLQTARTNSQTSVNEQLKHKDEYYQKMLEQNRSTMNVRIMQLDNQIIKLREELNVSQKDLILKTRDLIRPQIMNEEIKKRQTHLILLLDQNAAMFQSQEEKLLKEIIELKEKLTKSEGTIKNITSEQMEFNQLRQQLEQIHSTMVPILHFEEQIRKQQHHFTQLLDMNATTYMEQEKKFEVEIQQLKLKLSSAQVELNNSRNQYNQLQQLRSKVTSLTSELQTVKNSSVESQQLKLTIGNLQTQINNLRNVQNEAVQLRNTIGRLEIEISSLRDFQVEAQRLKINISNLQLELNSLRNIQAESQQLRTTLTNVQSELNSLRVIHVQATQLKSKLTSLENEVIQNRNVVIENQQLKATIQNLNIEIRGRTDVQNDYKSKLMTVENEIDVLRKELQRSRQQNLQIKQGPNPHQLFELELRKQEQHFARLLDENAHIFLSKEREFETHINQLQLQIERFKQSSINIVTITKQVESLRSQLQSQQQLYRSQLQTQDQLFKSQLQLLERQNKSQLLIIQKQSRKFLTDGTSSHFEQQVIRLKSELTLIQKDRDNRVQQNFDRIKFYDQHTDRLNKTVADLENKLSEAKNDIFRLKQVNHTLELTRTKLEDQLRTTGSSTKTAEEGKYLLLVEERHNLLIDFDRLKLKSQQDLSIRREIEQKYNILMREKSSMLQRIDKLQSLLYQKEMEMIKSFQKRQENIQELIAENKSLQLELKKIQQKLIAYEFKSVLSPPNHNQNDQSRNINNHQAQLQLLRDENGFVKERIRFLEGQLRDTSRYHDELARADISGDKYLLKMQGERIKQNLHEVQQNNMDLYMRLNSLIRVDGERDDVLEIGILKKINDQVTGLIDSNRLLVEQIRILQIENNTLNQTLVSLTRGNAGVSGPINSGEQMANQITRVLDSVADLLNEQSMSEQICDRYDHYMERLDGCLEKRNLARYLEIFEEFIRNIFIGLIEAKDHMLQKQAATLLELREKMGDLIDQQIEESEYSERLSPLPSHNHSMYDERNGPRRHDIQSLQHLVRHYLKYRRPDTLEEMGRVLHAQDE